MTQGTPTSSSRFFKILAGLFTLSMVILISVANRGDGDRWWSFIHLIPYGDKLGHVGLMTTLSLLFNLATTPRHFSFLPTAVTRATSVLVVLVTLEELSQAFIPTRTCDPMDWLADMIGLAIGQIIATAFKPKFSTSIF